MNLTFCAKYIVLIINFKANLKSYMIKSVKVLSIIILRLLLVVINIINKIR